MTSSETRFHAVPVIAVKADHQKTASVTMPRAPKRSAATPHGVRKRK